MKLSSITYISDISQKPLTNDFFTISYSFWYWSIFDTCYIHLHCTEKELFDLLKVKKLYQDWFVNAITWESIFTKELLDDKNTIFWSYMWDKEEFCWYEHLKNLIEDKYIQIKHSTKGKYYLPISIVEKNLKDFIKE